MSPMSPLIITDISQLRRATHSVKAGDDISDIVANLFDTMKYLNCWGLAANQLGYEVSIFVMTMEKPHPPICVVNPGVVKQKGEQIRNEGCECFPETSVSVKRPHSMVLKCLNQYFKPVKYKFSGLQARVAMHEIDHLRGKVITDYEEEGKGGL